MICVQKIRMNTKKHHAVELNFFFGNFFQRVKKLINFKNFVRIKVAKSKLNYFGLNCKFLIGKSEKSGIEIEIEYTL